MTETAVPSPVRFSVRLPQTHCFADPESMASVAELCEELGYWGISVQDHLIANEGVAYCGDHHTDDGDDRIVYESLQTLAFVGARTSAVKLITGVLITPFRHAVLLAKEAASLDVFTGGRLVLGVGVGAPVKGRRSADGRQNLTAHSRIARQEFEAVGIAGHRGRIADEAIQVMKAIWSDEPATFRGEYYRFEDLEVFPKPAQRPRPPIWVGGRSDAARWRVLTNGDAWFPSQISAGLYAEGVEWMRLFARDHGLPMPRDLGVNIFTAVDRDGEGAREVNRRTFGHRFTPEWLSAVTLGGNPEEVISQIQAFTDLGVNAVDLKLVPPRLDETIKQIRLMADEVMPAFASG